ncbi:leucine-, glutamate- and lysine-rich protein 1-like [Lingula anatina]|uniref:Leucine-, glutamate- and lysine-rich protein 1-like n=1 Tax=Lingula anatina TaxID=7574 RepID=A0A1S3HAM1_LINAN|nr:leucine-, glutamate- and lysine-rich protein 1-like [Lingula anatina]XP_013383089.1 leucine-, glutamate- and lysine-rich protein 1-like [Lingula anatina]|eukprot:XP_013383087.1 leucine-, glutamate- and lysine-rich protein 1-like [Lingula anatina]
MANKDGEKFEYHTPEHPLPEEIQKMERGETVCKFCGVSYLIHREIKALEDKLTATQKELERYKGCEEKERLMRQELKVVQDKFEEQKQTIEAKDAILSKLKQQVSDKEENINRLKSSSKELEERLGKSIQDGEKCRLQLNSLRQSLPPLILTLQQQKSSLQNIQTFVEHRDRITKEEFARIKTAVHKICSAELSETQKSKTKVTELEKENQVLQGKLAELTDAVTNYKSQQDKLKTEHDQAAILLQERDALQKEFTNLKNQYEKSVTDCRAVTFQAEQYKEQLRAKSQEVENAIAQQRKRDQTAESNVTRLTRELKAAEAQLAMSEKERDVLIKRFDEQRRTEQEIKNKASATENKTEEMKAALYRTQEELMALKAERESMILSHQNRIEQLKDSFRRKIQDSEQWPEKLEEALRSERQKHAAEIRLLEEKLKENFVMEMQIEKEKHQELVEKYVRENKNSESKVQSELTMLGSKHKAEMVEVQRQLRECRANSTHMENSLREEIGNLKTIIAELEERLGKVDFESDEVVLKLKGDLRGKDQMMEELRGEVSSLEQQLANAKEDNDLLQDTVRRECEERFELTEALSALKEELLQYKKPATGYGQSQRAASLSPGVSVARQDSPKDSPGQRSNSTGNSYSVPHPPPQPASLPSYMSSTSTTMGFDGDRAKTPGKFKGGNVADIRKRIAATMGRK